MLSQSEVTRVAVLTNAIPNYRTPIFQGVSNFPDYRFRFFVSAPMEKTDARAQELLDIKQSRTLNLRWRTRTKSAKANQVENLPISFSLFFDIIRFRPDVIISGELGLRSLTAYLTARILRVPLAVWTEETITHASLVGNLQKQLRKFLLPRADAFLAWGKPAIRFLSANDISSKKIIYCAQAIDNSSWKRQAMSSDIQTLRRKHKIRGRMCLAVGRLIPRKGFMQLIAAFGALPDELKTKNSLVLVGAGPEKDALEHAARSMNISNFVLAGPKSPDELAGYYSAANFLVMPSLSDVWGLVVNEAMACGTPVLSSIHAGATEELIIDTGLGEAFDPTDKTQFTLALKRWLTAPRLKDDPRLYQAAAALDFRVSKDAIRQLINSLIRKPNVD